MSYALLGDLHSSIDDTKAVLQHIRDVAPQATLIGTGDLFECIISKKRITERFERLEDVILRPSAFEELLVFPSVKGNQEERIELIMNGRDPLLDDISQYPEVIEVPGAEVIHGHQWEWSGDPWLPAISLDQKKMVFFGHSHRSAFFMDNQWHKPNFDFRYSFWGKRVGVNVGSVIENREWVLYEPTDQSVIFQKVK